jgi:peptidoglycan hydrolase-like protein with peptidoglycan-binding domain
MGFDGVLRSRTRQALIIFQQRQGLQASGPGSTPHDVDAQPATLESCSPSLVLDWPRWRS